MKILYASTDVEEFINTVFGPSQHDEHVKERRRCIRFPMTEKTRRWFLETHGNYEFRKVVG